jgi:DNA-binding transcriptional LysR family regulator
MNSTGRKPLPRLSRLRAFDHVAATSAMNAAAEVLHVTQPAVTRAIAALEEELNVRLLERQRTGSFLTREGVIFARRTNRFFHQLHAALADIIGASAEDEPIARLSRKISDLHIRSLVAIGRARSFRGAARMLGVAEPSLHRPAREIERIVRAPLYRRTSDGVGLSPAGVELARRFTLGIVEIETGIRELEAHRGSSEMTATVGVLALAPKAPLATVAKSLRQNYPRSRLVIQEGAYDDLVTGLRSGAIDVIFGALREPTPFSDLYEESLFEDPYRIVCRRKHPLTRIARPRPSDLKSYDWVFPTAALPRRDVLEGILAKWRLSPRVQVETNSLGTLIADLTLSDHISLLPSAYINADDHSTLATVDIRVPHAKRNVGMTMRQDWLPTTLQSDLLARMRHVTRRTKKNAAHRPGR